jgi:uncharacterized protein DUF4112
MTSTKRLFGNDNKLGADPVVEPRSRTSYLSVRHLSEAGSNTGGAVSVMDFASSGGFSGFRGFDRPGSRRSQNAYSGEERRAAFERLDRIASLLDIAFVMPGTNVHFGVEAVLRLVPGIGDAAASLLSCYLLYEARRLGVPKLLVARMAANVAFEGLIGTVPLLGDAFDVYFRANRRNIALLRRHFEGPPDDLRQAERT